MATFKIKDPTLELTASMTGALAIDGPKFRPVLDALYNLNLELPMSEYNITRVGVTDVWNVTAEAKDARAYSSTVSIPANVPKYTLTNLPAGTANELTVFLALIQAFAALLKTYAFTSVSIEWT
jgi:hypothetical protein